MMITVQIETPKGSAAKYELDRQTGQYKVNKLLPASLCFPFDFGFIPGTIAEDGDPFDVVVISEFTAVQGSTMECRIIGCLTAEQKEPRQATVRNDRYIAIPEVSEVYTHVRELAGLPQKMMEDLNAFFVFYNRQAGKTFTPLVLRNAAAAVKMIRKAQKEQRPKRYLVELFLPLHDNKGKAFPAQYYTSIRDLLTKKFGGATYFTRKPAEGTWKEGKDPVQQDALIVCEVMTDRIEEAFWAEQKAAWKKLFRQKELLIRCVQAGLI